MKNVESLTTSELFDRVSLAMYYGAAVRNQLRNSPTFRKAMETVLAELRQDEFLREAIETDVSTI
jgi:hypothetical protein